MIEVEEKSMETLFNRAIQQADKDKQTKIASYTKRIEATDPLHFFEAAKRLNKNRTFWTSTADDFFLVGIGNALEIVADESRFAVTKKEWQELLDEAIIHDPYREEGTGVVALGGMSFDPQCEQKSLWKNFQSSQFTVPEFILLKSKNNYYLTMITVVTKNDYFDDFINKWGQIHELIHIDEVTKFPTAAVIESKHEIGISKWLDSVQKAINEIKNNRAKKIVLAREMRVKLDKQAEVSVILKKLIEKQKNSYIFAFEQDEDCFIGATPERLVKIQGKDLLSTCLAGTAPRGNTAEEDKQISEELFHDEKNREEHEYVVQMIKKSMKSYCTDIDIPAQPVVYHLKNLHHLYTPVQAKLKEDASIFDIIEKLHPTPALGGVPRDASLAFIREHEQMDRGWYGAPVGWLDSNENGEFAVAIRSGLIQGDEVSLFAGCGVMKDSDPELEFEETNVKLLPMLSVLEDA
ncbi:isochorismate synthase [Virgibacillus sp. W0181]|uniref:isochorismate synthase n=1 Tax=Virgibacillus sp. W0181 TaxID=3391581 RepID=UPI003F46BE53